MYVFQFFFPAKTFFCSAGVLVIRSFVTDLMRINISELFFSQFYVLNDILKSLNDIHILQFLFNIAQSVYLEPQFKVTDHTLYSININNKHVHE